MSIAKRALELPESNGLRKQIIVFLGGGTDKFQNATYTGKSKKITSKEVMIIKKGKEKSKIKDMNDNESTVLNSQLIFL
jgi:hypothetical protein